MKRLYKLLLLAAVLLIFPLFLVNCGIFSSSVVNHTENIQLKDFSGVKLDCNARVQISQSESFKIQVIYPKDSVRLPNFLLKGDTLVIANKGDYLDSLINVRISMPSVAAVDNEKGGVINLALFPHLKNLHIIGEGDSKTAIEHLNASRIYVELYGKSVVTFDESNSDSLNVIANGSGSLVGADLRCTHVGVDDTSSNNLELYANKSLTGSLRGAGDIIYSGNPVLALSNTGHGHIIHKKAAKY